MVSKTFAVLVVAAMFLPTAGCKLGSLSPSINTDTLLPTLSFRELPEQWEPPVEPEEPASADGE